jgi:hypothetical protein
MADYSRREAEFQKPSGTHATRATRSHATSAGKRKLTAVLALGPVVDAVSTRVTVDRAP